MASSLPSSVVPFHALRRATPAAAPGVRPRLLSEADCRDILQRLARAAVGGGYTAATIWSQWTGNVRWARNQISTAGEVQQNYIKVSRDRQGADHGWVLLNETSDAALVAAARRAERLAQLRPQEAQWDVLSLYGEEAMTTPQLFSEATYQLDAAQRAAAAIALAKVAADAGVLSAGYIEVSAHSVAMLDTLGHARYVPWTCARVSMTVRDPTGTGSGWAGVDWPDWHRIDGAALAALALDKCLTSRHPVAVEPGRYTTILEPQAVSDVVGQLFNGVFTHALKRECNEGHCFDSSSYPFFKDNFHSKVGEKIVDERITISADPLDPDLGFPPFYPGVLPYFSVSLGNWWASDVYHPVTWIKDGVLTALEFHRQVFGGDEYGQHIGTGLPNAGAFRMSGGTTSIAEMIATTERGLLVTRFDQVLDLDLQSLLLRGYTRDGVWLIEHGKVTKAVKNLAFTESILFALNNVEQLGVPVRVFHPPLGGMTLPQPVIVPPLKVKDFRFTALVDAV
jgi:predicted Zn-dependent protease